ncbi:MAG TPA: hypothetical protein VF786_08405 [Terriglobales bacterium]
MKNIVEVLRQKEAVLQQLQNEVEILRRALSLLSEEGDVPLGARPLAQTGTDVRMVQPGTDVRNKAAISEMTNPRQFP